VVDAFAAHRSIDAVFGAVNSGEPDWEELFFNQYIKIMQSFGERTLNGFKADAGPKEFKSEFKIEPDAALDLFIAEARRRAREFAGKRIKDINETTRKRLGRVIERGLADGLPLAEIQADIESLYEGFAGKRSRIIARTETLGAQNFGSLQSVRALKSDNLLKVWLWSNVSRLDHAAIDGTAIPLSRRFSVGSTTLDHPGDPFGAPEEVINCSCSLDYRRA